MSKDSYGLEDLSLANVEVDLDCAVHLLGVWLTGRTKNSNYKRRCAYFIQQAYEKMLKMQLYKYNGAKVVRTHNIDKLIVLCRKYKGVLIPSDLDKYSYLITNWEVSGRYDEAFSVNEIELRNHLNICWRMYESLLKKGYPYKL